MREPSSGTVLFAAVAASLALHVVGLSTLASVAKRTADTKRPPVKVRIVEVAPEPKKEPPPKVEPPKAKPKPHPKKKIKPKVATERPKPAVPPKQPPKPVQGLTASAMTPGGKIAVPLGNTLMMEDTGERLKKAPPPMDADLSADAKLVRDSITTPKYTDAALDASIEGLTVVDVLVDESGKVTDAELKHKVGYGMDERILAAAFEARFVPRKNKLGRPESGWTEIRFNLQIP